MPCCLELDRARAVCDSYVVSLLVILSSGLLVDVLCVVVQSAPNPDDPLANDVAELWKTDERTAIATAADWTRRYAQADT